MHCQRLRNESSFDADPPFIQIKLNLEMLSFQEGRKLEDLGEKPLEQGREPATASTHIWWFTIQYNTIQYNTIQYNTIQYNTIQYNTIQYNTIQYNTIQYNTIQYNTIHLCEGFRLLLERQPSSLFNDLTFACCMLTRYCYTSIQVLASRCHSGWIEVV